MIIFDLSLEIAAPRADVFAWWSDPHNIPKWQSGVVRVDFEGEAGKGARYTVVRKALGMTQEMRTTIIDFVDGERLVEKARGGPATNSITTTFTDAGGGRTRMDSHVEIDLGGVLGRLGDKLAAGKLKSQAKSDQQRLKKVLESL
ncbi:MAG: SRPBCC family protein [Deltaproteobacteria bacterium]|nr:SRPBCC family protein [Deltaproteobacteria bacterium]